MVDEIAEEITDTADEDQNATSSDNTAVTTPDANSTILSDDDAATTDDAAKTEDADGDEVDGDGEAEPVSYDDLSIPEGMPVDEAALGEFKDIAAKMNDGQGLSKDDAQLLVDFRAKMVKESAGDWETKFSEWRGELLSDKEIGGDNFKEITVPNVLAAAERFGDKDMLNLLQTNKMYGENPALIRMLNRVGETLREDELVRGRAAGDNGEEARLRRMYPSHYNDDGSVKNRHKGSPA